MARANVGLVRALRATADRIRAGASYEWGHFGACNCGHLAQTVTQRTRSELQRFAIAKEDWAEIASDFRPSSGQPIDDVVAELVAAGLTREDLVHLERLDDPAVLAAAGAGHLRRNERDAVVLYLDAWAFLLEQQLFQARRAARRAVPSRDAA